MRTAFPLRFALLFSTALCPLAGQTTFTNPILPHSADPSVVFVPNSGSSGGEYYAVVSGCVQNNGIAGPPCSVYLATSATIPGFSNATWTAVYTTPSSGPNSTNLWAPQIRYFPNQSQPWYIYFSAVSSTDGPNNYVDHRLFALVPSSDTNVTGTRSWVAANNGNPVGQLNSNWVNSLWAIDPDVFQASDGNYYLIFACRQNNSETPSSLGWYQSICISEMANPNPIQTVGMAVAISEPTQPWETRNFPTEEGPFGVVPQNGSGQPCTSDPCTDYILYSASFSGSPDDYAVGMLSNTHPVQANGGNPLLNPAAWVKQGPLLDGHDYAYGTASTVLTLSPDGSQVWNVYHATDCITPGSSSCSDSGGNTWPDRSTRAQSAGWSETGQLVLGYPVDVADTDQGNTTVPLPDPPNDGNHNAAPAKVTTMWGDAFGDAAEGDTTDGLDSCDGIPTCPWWTSPTSNGIADASGTGTNFVSAFYYANPNWDIYTVFTNFQLGSTDNAAPHPKSGIYAAYVDHLNYMIAMVDPICGGTPAAPTPCVTVSGVVQGSGGSTWSNCPLSQLPSRQAFSPTGVNSLAVEVTNSTYNVIFNGIPLTGACTGNTYYLYGANQPQPGNAYNNVVHSSNGQVGVISQDMAVTYTNFSVSYGVPAAPSSGLSQLYGLQSHLANQFNLDSGGATSSGSNAVQTYTTAKNPANYTNATPPAPASWTANTQLWQLRAETAGSFEISNAANGLCLDLSGSNVVQNTCNASTATQNWWFIPVALTSGVAEAQSNSFLIQNASTLQVIDAGSGTVNNNLSATTRNAPALTSQKWQLILQ